MCEPISLGIATAAAGGAQAIAGHQSAKRQAYLTNKARVDQYGNALANRDLDYRQRLSVYGQQMAEFEEGGDRDISALRSGYTQAQMQLNDVNRSNAFARDAQQMAVQKAIGSFAARGTTGTSALRGASNALAAYGRNQAIMEQNIMGARNRYMYNTDQLRNQYRSSRNRAYSQVANAPLLGIAPAKPTLVDGPSNLSLIAGLGQAAVSGVSAGMSLKADNPVPGAKPPTEIPKTDFSTPTPGGWTLPEGSAPMFNMPSQ